MGDITRWANSQAGAREERALRAIDQLPADDRGRVLHPFGWVDKSGFKAATHEHGRDEAIRQAPIVTVPLKGLVGTQRTVRADILRSYVEDPDQVPEGTLSDKWHGPIDHPIVMQWRGARMIWDGHHRLTAAALLGERSLAVRLVVFADDGTPAYLAA